MIKTHEERLKKCFDLYEGEKSRNFMLHMTRAYSFWKSVNRVFAFREQQRHKCALCDIKLASVTEAAEHAFKDEAARAASLAIMKSAANIEQPVDETLAKHAVKIAYEGDGTDTCLCDECAVAVKEFAMKSVLDGDKRINRIITELREKESGIVRERRDPKYVHNNVQAAVSMKDAPGFSKLLSVFQK